MIVGHNITNNTDTIQENYSDINNTLLNQWRSSRDCQSVQLSRHNGQQSMWWLLGDQKMHHHSQKCCCIPHYDLEEQSNLEEHKNTSLVFPTALYGCESWAMKKADHKLVFPTAFMAASHGQWRRLITIELKLWSYWPIDRRLLLISWMEKRTNQYVLEKIGVIGTSYHTWTIWN